MSRGKAERCFSCDAETRKVFLSFNELAASYFSTQTLGSLKKKKKNYTKQIQQLSVDGGKKKLGSPQLRIGGQLSLTFIPLSEVNDLLLRGAYIRGLGPRDPAACLLNLCVAASAVLSFTHKSSLLPRRAVSPSISSSPCNNQSIRFKSLLILKYAAKVSHDKI